MPLRVFVNGGIITDGGILRDHMLVVRDDRIEAIEPQREIPKDAERIDCGGLFLAPGFIDLHIHGGSGSDFMDATPEAVETVFRYHAEHGTTALCPTTATAPLVEITAALDEIQTYRSGPQRYGRALGSHIEGPYLTMSKRGCHLPEFVRNPEEHEWRELFEHGPVATMTLAPELPGANELIAALRHHGAIASAGHSEALYHEISAAVDRGVSHVTHLYCAMTDSMNNRWRGTSNPRSAGIVEAVYLDDRLSSELITDGKHLSREMLVLALRNKGYEKLAIVTDAMRAAGMPDGVYAFGPKHGMQAVVRNREARIPDGTALASSVFPMNEMVATFCRLTGAPLWQSVRMASLTPAEIAGCADELGSLAPGKHADIALIDVEVNVHGVWIGGEKI